MGEIDLDLNDLHDVEFVETKVKKYLKKRKFFQRRKFLQRRGCILANEGEKFLGIRNVHELAFGLNNIVYNLNIVFQNNLMSELVSCYKAMKNPHHPKLN